MIRDWPLAFDQANYRDNDTASAIPRPRKYTGWTLTFVLPPEGASNLMCGFEFAASAAHPTSAPIPVQTAAATSIGSRPLVYLVAVDDDAMDEHGSAKRRADAGPESRAVSCRVPGPFERQNRIERDGDIPRAALP